VPRSPPLRYGLPCVVVPLSWGFQWVSQRRSMPARHCSAAARSTCSAKSAAVATAHHADNRMMFSFGKSAIEAGLLPPEMKLAVGLPLSATGKSPFFDRK